MKVRSESEIAQSCLTLSDPMDCSLPGFSIHGIFQARVLEWGVNINNNSNGNGFKYIKKNHEFIMILKTKSNISLVKFSRC